MYAALCDQFRYLHHSLVVKNPKAIPDCTCNWPSLAGDDQRGTVWRLEDPVVVRHRS
jgi:hypothetical protein